MKYGIGLLGGLVFLTCCLVFVVNVIFLIEAKVSNNQALLKSTLKILLITLIVAMVGFGMCSVWSGINIHE